MTGLLICAAVAAVIGSDLCHSGGHDHARGDRNRGWVNTGGGLALLAVALWLAYAAGGA